MRRLALSILVLMSGALAGCSDFTSNESETLLRYSASEDALLVLETHHGLEVGSSRLPVAIKALTDLGAGHRRYPIDGGLFCLDLDSPEQMAAGGDDPLLALLRSAVPFVHVDQSALFRDEAGQLAFVRLTRIDRCREFLNLVDDFLDRQAIDTLLDQPASESEAKSPLSAGTFPWFDEATVKAVREAFRANHRWLAVEGDSIVVDLPMTESNAARCVAWLADPAHKEAGSEYAKWLDQVSSMRIADGHALLRFGGAEHPVLRFTEGSKDENWNDALLRGLEESHVSIGSAIVATKARAAFDAFGADRSKETPPNSR